MDLTPETDLTVFIARDGNELVTDSRAVALAFNKQHTKIMRTIRAGSSSAHPEIAAHYRANFGAVEFADAKGERRPMYRMTVDGLSELAMGFTGDSARLVRIRFIAAFREMARRLDSAEKTITQMLHDYEKRAAVSATKGSIGSLLMHGRRKEKRPLDDEEARLKSLSQPRLFNEVSHAKH